MNIRRIKAFVVTASLENMTSAADQLAISQPALSRQIQTFEEELGITLFDRVGKNVKLSIAGESVLGLCEDILNRVTSLRDFAQSTNGGDAGLLRIGASPQLIERLFPRFLRLYQHANPKVEINLISAGGAELAESLDNGTAHIVMGSFVPKSHHQVVSLGSLAVIAWARHAMIRNSGPTIELTELNKHPLLILTKGFKSREVFDSACSIVQSNPHVVLESGAPHTLLALASSGHGVAILPSSVAVQRDELRTWNVTSGGARLDFALSAVWDSRRVLPNYARRFIAQFARHIDEEYPDLAHKIADTGAPISSEAP